MAKKSLTLKKAVKALSAHGLLRGLKSSQLDALLEEAGSELTADDDIGTEKVFWAFDAYYSSPDENSGIDAIKDGYIRHDWRYGQETDDIVAEFCQACGRTGWFTLQSIGSGDQLRIVSEHKPFLIIDGSSLENVADFFNDQLTSIGDDKQFYSLETGGDWFAFLCLNKASYEEICKAGLLPLPGAELVQPRRATTSQLVAKLLASEKADPEDLSYLAKDLEKAARANDGTQDPVILDEEIMRIYQRSVDEFLKQSGLSSNYRARSKLIEAGTHLARLFTQHSRLAEACALCDIIMEQCLEPETKRLRGLDCLILKACSLMELERFEASLASLDEALALNEYSPDAHFFRSLALERLGRTEESLRAKQQAIQNGYSCAPVEFDVREIPINPPYEDDNYL